MPNANQGTSQKPSQFSEDRQPTRAEVRRVLAALLLLCELPAVKAEMDGEEIAGYVGGAFGVFIFAMVALTFVVITCKILKSILCDSFPSMRAPRIDFPQFNRPSLNFDFPRTSLFTHDSLFNHSRFNDFGTFNSSFSREAAPAPRIVERPKRAKWKLSNISMPTLPSLPSINLRSLFPRRQRGIEITEHVPTPPAPRTASPEYRGKILEPSAPAPESPSAEQSLSPRVPSAPQMPTAVDELNIFLADNQEVDLPQGYEYMRCPITQEVMNDPVTLIGSGQVFERKALQDWLSKHDTCPVTRKKVDKHFVEGYLLRNKIQDDAKYLLGEFKNKVDEVRIEIDETHQPARLR